MSRPIVTAVVVAVVALVVFPSVAHAWTPGTHIVLGDAVLRSLHLLPAGVADLLRAFPYDFLYGSIAADTSLAKKYAETGRHCHSWRIGFEIQERADDERLRAFALGYLAHLAADVVAHNFFVPHRLATTSSTVALGHSYWESRFEARLGDGGPRRAREVILLDHSRADAHLDRILSPTIFSTSTNRRFFRGMVYVTDLEPWQRVMQIMADNSRWDLTEGDVDSHLSRSFDYIIDLLVRLDRSEPFAHDPSGDEPLREAKRLRRVAWRQGGETQVQVEADRAFGLPRSDLGYAAALGPPIYPAVRAESI